MEPSGRGGVTRTISRTPCDSGGNGSHKDGGRINGGAARNVEADPVQGGNSLPKAVACEITDGVSGKFSLVVLDAAGGESQGVGDLGGDFIQGGIEVALRNFQAVRRQAVDAAEVFEESGVALGTDVVEDAGDGFGE